MYFASKYIYANDEEEYESMCEDEFSKGMDLSDSSEEEDVDALVSIPRRSSQAKKTKTLRGKKYHWKRKKGEPTEPEARGGGGAEFRPKRQFRKADTNVVSVSFNALLSPSNMYAGDPMFCPVCSAILSNISKVEDGTGEKVWQCEFCSERVAVDLEEGEIPTTEDVTYLLAPAPATANTSASGKDSSLVIFCVDTSGSMCVTSEISGKVKLRGTNQLRRLQSFQEDRSDQFLPSQKNRQVTYVSRLQAMQAAVDHQLGQMASQHPDRRVGLVAFNNEVAIMGDGSQQEVIVAGDKLKDLAKLKEVAAGATLPQDIKKSRTALRDKVYSLEEGGATALGPALVVAINMAASHPGSKVILCTDGKANIGLGKLEADSGETLVEDEAQEFYTKMGEEAAEKGVTVSVITIEGTDCKLVHLGALADKTGGQVNIVDCMKLTEEFGNILADPVIATKVKATLLLHKEMFVVDNTDEDKQESRAEQNVGNVKTSSTVTFEFAKRRGNKDKNEEGKEKKKDENTTAEASPAEQHQERSEASGVGASTSEGAGVGASTSEGAGDAPAVADLKSGEETPQELPFQLQIEYVDTEGNKALRVITRRQPVTNQRHLAESAVNLEVLGTHVAQKSADLALKGQYTTARSVALMNQRLAWRQAHSDSATKTDKAAYKNIFSKIKSMENFVQRQQTTEISRRGTTYSDDEDESEESETPSDCVVADSAPRALHLSAPAAASSSAEARPRSFLDRMFAKKGKGSKAYIASKNKRMHSERSSEMDDNMANMMYKFRSVASSDISAPVDLDGMNRQPSAPVPLSSEASAKPIINLDISEDSDKSD